MTAELSEVKSRNENGDLSDDVIELAHEIDDYIDRIQHITAEKERIETELALAEEIQEPDACPEKVLANVRESIDEFVQDAEQFDDLTMLCIQYNGTGQPA